jgi:glycosyltransferase involved in cell wall biosynthesis
MVIIEAMACGLPVVSFDCPFGPGCIIKDGIDGVLVENGRVDKLADALNSIMSNPDMRRELAKNAVINVQRYRIDRIADRWRQLFESLV